MRDQAIKQTRTGHFPIIAISYQILLDPFRTDKA